MNRPQRFESSAPSHPAAPTRQMSHANVFAFRPRRAEPVIEVTREEAQDWWAGVLNRHFRTTASIAWRFQVTEQTARNWLAGTSRPHSDILLQAVIWWPEEFQAFACACDDFQVAA